MRSGENRVKTLMFHIGYHLLALQSCLLQVQYDKQRCRRQRRQRAGALHCMYAYPVAAALNAIARDWYFTSAVP
jgi:hypothetical protein